MRDKLLFVFYTLVFNSCVSVSNIAIKVLEPASDPVTPEISSIAVLNRTVLDETDETEKLDSVFSNQKNKLYNQTTTEIIFSLADILNESPGIDFMSENELLEISSADLTLIPELLSPEYVINTCDSLNVNALLSLDTYNIEYSDTIKVVGERARASTDSYYLGKVNVNITTLWRIYEHLEGNLVDEHLWFDTLNWQHASYFANEIPNNLPSIEEVLMEAAYYTAITYARRISPYWIVQERVYFSRGNRNLRIASNYMSKYMFVEAEMFYDNLLGSRNKNIVAAAKLNLSLISEIRGDYRQALNLARRSYQLRRHPASDDYIKIIEERIKKSNQLDQQLGRIP